MQVIINAGGEGSRLWPLSTKASPKQFANILDHESLLQKTYFRLLRRFRSDQIWVTTNQKHRILVGQQLGPNFQGNNILTEPERRDTFAAVIAHSALVSGKTSKDEVLVFISSDHHFDSSVDYDNYIKTFDLVNDSLKANEYDIILPATKPYYPATGYGYIKFDTNSKAKVNPVLAFKEKPNLAVAEKFVASKEYYWNLGYFAFKYSSLEKIITEFYPDLIKVLDNIAKTQTISQEDYSQIQKDSFDIAILEKAHNLGTVDMNLSTWDDLGNFETLYDYYPKLENSEVFYQADGDGNKAIVADGTKIAFAGVSNLLVIQNTNGILVINPKKSSSKVKEIAAKFDNN
jgi:mannose-1-phosphate guanylyltransferase